MMYTGNTYMLIYFIYGLAFFTMGITAIQKKSLKNSNFSLLRATKQLGYFGIIHGIVEWIVLLTITNQYPDYEYFLWCLIAVLSVLSYIFLWSFGLKLFFEDMRIKWYQKYTPHFLLGVWIFSLLFFNIFVSKDIKTLYFFIAISRYFIALPACITVSVGFYRNAESFRELKLKKISVKFIGLSILFGVYGILAGFVVKSHMFFPANIINAANFQELFGIPVELARTIVVVFITFIYINVTDVFMWEAEYKIEKLVKQKIIFQERKKLGQELHDSVIQNLFAAGLMVENMIDEEESKDLSAVKFILNGVISEIRGFIDQSSMEKFALSEFEGKLKELLIRLEIISNLKISLEYKVPDVVIGQISSNKVIQIYYIIQEAVSNSIKHSSGNEINVRIATKREALLVNVTDDGNGFHLNNGNLLEHHGLVSMTERAASIDGDLNIKTDSAGVIVSLSVPWEDRL